MDPEASETRPRLGVVVVNYGSHELVDLNLSSLSFGDIPTRVVVVDNFSSGTESRLVEELCRVRGWTLVQNHKNLGFGGGMNAGVARAQALGCSLFLLINPDATMEAGDLAGLFARSVADPLTLLSPVITKPDGSRWFGGGTVLVDRGITSTAEGADSSLPHGWLSGACLMVHEELWRRTGGFDEGFFLYWEDIDFSWRCVAAGGALAVAGEAGAVHSVGGTQRSAGKSSAYVYYNCRNRLWFAAKHLSRRQVLSWLGSSGRYGRMVILRGGRRALLRRPFALVGAAIGGTVAGMARTVRVRAPKLSN